MPKALEYPDKTHFPKPVVIASRTNKLEKAVTEALNGYRLKDLAGKKITPKHLLAALYNSSGNVFKALSTLNCAEYAEVALALQECPEFKELLSAYNWKTLQKASEVLDEALDSDIDGVRIDAAKFILKLEADKRKNAPQVAVQVNQVASDDIKAKVLEVFGLNESKGAQDSNGQ